MTESPQPPERSGNEPPPLDQHDHARLVSVVLAASTHGPDALRRLWDDLVLELGPEAASRLWQEALSSSDIGQT